MKTLLTLSLAALWAHGAAVADALARAPERMQTKEDVQAVFEAIDRNDDQRISRAEAAREKSLRNRFAAVDSSGDGFLSEAEFRARPSPERFE